MVTQHIRSPENIFLMLQFSFKAPQTHAIKKKKTYTSPPHQGVEIFVQETLHLTVERLRWKPVFICIQLVHGLNALNFRNTTQQNHFSAAVVPGPLNFKASWEPFQPAYVHFMVHISVSAHCTNKRPFAVSFLECCLILSRFFSNRRLVSSGFQWRNEQCEAVGFWQEVKPTSDCLVAAVRLVTASCPRVCHTGKQWGKIMYWFEGNRMNTVEMWKDQFVIGDFGWRK